MKIISEKDLYVPLASGHAFRLEAGVPSELPEFLALEGLKRGAKEYDKKYVEEQNAEIAEFEEVAEETLEPDIDLALLEALNRIIEQGNPEDFKVDGTPKATVVNKATGRTVRSDERDAAWEVALNA